MLHIDVEQYQIGSYEVKAVLNMLLVCVFIVEKINGLRAT